MYGLVISYFLYLHHTINLEYDANRCAAPAATVVVFQRTMSIRDECGTRNEMQRKTVGHGTKIPFNFVLWMIAGDGCGCTRPSQAGPSQAGPSQARRGQASIGNGQEVRREKEGCVLGVGGVGSGGWCCREEDIGRVYSSAKTLVPFNITYKCFFVPTRSPYIVEYRAGGIYERATNTFQYVRFSVYRDIESSRFCHLYMAKKTPSRTQEYPSKNKSRVACLARARNTSLERYSTNYMCDGG